MTEHICTCGHKSFGHENGTDECLAIGCGCEKAVEQISTPTDQHERGDGIERDYFEKWKDGLQ